MCTIFSKNAKPTLKDRIERPRLSVIKDSIAKVNTSFETLRTVLRPLNRRRTQITLSTSQRTKKKRNKYVFRHRNSDETMRASVKSIVGRTLSLSATKSIAELKGSKSNIAPIVHLRTK